MFSALKAISPQSRRERREMNFIRIPEREILIKVSAILKDILGILGTLNFRHLSLNIAYGPIAQLAEPPAHNRSVPGSNPGGPTLSVLYDVPIGAHEKIILFWKKFHCTSIM